MSIVTKFECDRCGNTDPKESKYYDGALGYEAIICKKCGSYSDHTDSYDANEWSLDILGITQYYIDYLDCKNRFKKTRKWFVDYNISKKWMYDNIEKPDIDMIRINYKLKYKL